MVLINSDILGQFLQPVTIHTNLPDPVVIFIKGSVYE
jgi:hypothetical protein